MYTGHLVFIPGHMPELETGFNMGIVGVIITILGLNKHKIWQDKFISFLGIWLILSGLVFSNDSLFQSLIKIFHLHQGNEIEHTTV